MASPDKSDRAGGVTTLPSRPDYKVLPPLPCIASWFAINVLYCAVCYDMPLFCMALHWMSGHLTFGMFSSQKNSINEDYHILWDVSLGCGINGNVVCVTLLIFNFLILSECWFLPCTACVFIAKAESLLLLNACFPDPNHVERFVIALVCK